MNERAVENQPPLADGAANSNMKTMELDPGSGFFLVTEGAFAPRIDGGNLILTVISRDLASITEPEAKKFAYDCRSLVENGQFANAGIDYAGGQFPLNEGGGEFVPAAGVVPAWYARQFKLKKGFGA